MKREREREREREWGERERERVERGGERGGGGGGGGERGGGVKGSAHFALQILVGVVVATQKWVNSIIGPSLSEASVRRSTSPLS